MGIYLFGVPKGVLAEGEGLEVVEKRQLFGQVGDEGLVDAQHVEVLEQADAARYHLDRIDLVVWSIAW